MSTDRPAQTYATHTRFHPWFHFITIPILAINALITLAVAILHPGLLHWWLFIVSLALISTALLARYYGLRLQDRLIRLEERVRLTALLPPDLRSRINELHTSDLIGIRFCSDEEVADVVRAVLNGEVKGRAAIKARVKNWRPDYHRL